jgi:hypothetical protein
MSSKHRDPKHPTEKQIEVVGKALERMKREELERLGEHFQALQTEQSAAVSTRNTLLAAIVQHGGMSVLPATAAEAEQFCDRIEVLAKVLARRHNAERHVALKELVAELKVRDLPDHLVWAAAKAGVTIFDNPNAPAAPSTPVGDDAPRIITS